MESIMAVYPRHKAVVDTFVARGEVIGIGPFQIGEKTGRHSFDDDPGLVALAMQIVCIHEGVELAAHVFGENDE